jgi:excisionase family DNA binding protein
MNEIVMKAHVVVLKIGRNPKIPVACLWKTEYKQSARQLHEVAAGRIHFLRRTMQTAIQEIREVMDIRQAADYLGISSDTLYKYASEGLVPAFKLGNRWRFKKTLLDSWMDEQSAAAKVVEIKTVKPAEKKPVRRAR